MTALVWDSDRYDDELLAERESANLASSQINRYLTACGRTILMYRQCPICRDEMVPGAIRGGWCEACAIMRRRHPALSPREIQIRRREASHA